MLTSLGLILRQRPLRSRRRGSGFVLRLLLLLISACCWPHQAQVAASPSLDVLERDRVRFDRSLVEPLGLANLDDNALCLVLDQLLDNAFRHGGTGKTIRFTVRPLPQESFCALELISIGSAPPVGDNELNRWQRPLARAEIERDGRYVEGAGLGLPHFAVVECCHHDDDRLNLAAPGHALQSEQTLQTVHSRQHQIQKNQVV